MRARTWSVTVITKDDGSERIVSTNDGFETLALLGVLSFKIQDIYNQMQAKVTQPEVIRKVTEVTHNLPPLTNKEIADGKV